MNLEKLNEIANTTREKIRSKKRIRVCAGSGCLSSGATNTFESLKQAVKDRRLEEDVEVISVGCIGACNHGPLVEINNEGVIYQKVKTQDALAIIDKHIQLNSVIPTMLLFAEGGKAVITEKAEESPFFKKQLKIVLENCGKIDPESIEDYIGVGGYRALHKALTTMMPEEVIAEIKQSGLRGRGGAGYPAGLKWETVYKHVNDTKYVICNGDEGDPGAFMDRSVLEGDPHRIIEGMAIAAYAVGAKKGYVYVRAEYPLAIKRLEQAIKRARGLGFLGRNIFETGFQFELEIRIGAGAFVCGEETALIASIEGKRGTPTPRPPYPAESGLWGKPTLINNVETLASIAPIIDKGGEWYSTIGTPKSAGTKVFALAGKINNTGLIEIPIGMTLREIIYEIGGGIPGDKKYKAAQTGGPSGGCIPEQFLDTKMDYEALVSLGSIMGSGGLIVMDETSCMVDVARFFMEFCVDESCGKCVPCRVGTKHMLDILSKICEGRASLDDLALLEELGTYLQANSLCGLGMTAPNPFQSTLRYFRDEYVAHIVDKKCPAGVCQMKLAEETVGV
jgi:NADH:ubiquinone oxidoreductase subunit F (NADH-binding)/(2Fe-2S) ferredoxin